MKLRSLLLAALLALAPSFALASPNCTLPFNLQNGQTADATQVMANYNALVACVGTAASAGANSDITSLTGLITPLSAPQGGSAQYYGSVVGGSANVITVTTTVPTNYALATGNRVHFKAIATNTGAATVNVDSTGVVAIEKQTPNGLAALTGGEIQTGLYFVLEYDGTEYQLLNGPGFAPAPASVGFVNKFRNPQFVSWPNGVSGTIATAPTGSAFIAASGWAVEAAGAAGTWAREATGHNGSYYAMRLTGAASNTDIFTAQRVSGSDAAPLAGNVVTIQFALNNQSGSSITPTVSTCYASTFEVFSTCTTDLTATSMQACPSATVCTEAYSFTANANAGNGYQIKFDFGGIASNADFVEMSAADVRVTSGVATGLNSSPPTPELPTQFVELPRDAAYLQTNYPIGTAPGASMTAAGGAGIASGGSFYFESINNFIGTGTLFPITMRAAPTVSYWDRAGNGSKFSDYFNGAWTDNVGGFSIFNIGPSGMFLYQNTSGVIGLFYFSAYADFW